MTFDEDLRSLLIYDNPPDGELRSHIGRKVIQAHHRLIVANCAVDRACAAANMSRGQLARALRLVAKAEKAE